jgi:hypothetical protein
MADTRNRIQRMGQGITMSTPTAEVEALRQAWYDSNDNYLPLCEPWQPKHPHHVRTDPKEPAE